MLLTSQSSLYKPFFDSAPQTTYRGQTMLKNDTIGVQFIVISPDDYTDAFVEIETALPYEVYETGNVPLLRPMTNNRPDDEYERKEPGIYPDPLKPLRENKRIRLTPRVNAAIYVKLNPSRELLTAGEYTVKATITERSNTHTCEVKITVVDGVLPEQSLIYTNWFHYDCLCDRYNCKMFDERHMELIEKYLTLAAENGMNMVLTPCFTPPLDTNIGGERMTAQLIDVEKTADGYSFGFDRLRAFFALAEKCGVKYYEHSHLFTQWGAKHAPKIVDINGNLLFGWDTDALDTNGEYAKFLGQYLTELVKVLEECGIGKRMYFHISDEPGVKSLDDYKTALSIIQPYIEGYHLFEALSSYEFYQSGAVETPIPTTSHAADFLGNVPDLWVYYTGGITTGGYSNRLISLPNARNRILGIQMWYHDIKGFLQWAYNFWYIRMSEYMFDPWNAPDADQYFHSGTSFMVYPGFDGPVPSIRLFSFTEGLDDYRALELYASKVGREKAEQFIRDSFTGLDKKLTETGNMLTYTPKADELLAFRDKLNRAIAEA